MMYSHPNSRQCFNSILLGSVILFVCNVSKSTASPVERQRYYEVIKPAVSLDTGPADFYQDTFTTPRKRAAIALDKLMYALKKALDSPGQDRPMMSSLRAPVSRNFVSSGVDRRGQPTDSRLYWRCYFNAVSCF